jgi:hypothetical protein
MSAAKHTYEANFYFIRQTSAYLGYKARTELYEDPERVYQSLMRMIYFKKNTIDYPNSWSSKKIKLTEYQSGAPITQKVKK